MSWASINNVKEIVKEGAVKPLREITSELGESIGALEDLETMDKSNLVAAINEAAQSGGSGRESKMLTGTLTASKWSNNSQTVAVSGLGANDNGVIGLLNTATDAQIEAAKEAKIKPTTQAENSMTFTAESTPAIDIPFGILIGGGGSGLSIIIDTILNADSENPVQNKAIFEQVEKKYSIDDAEYTDLDDLDYIPVYDTAQGLKKKTLWSNIKVLLGDVFQKKLDYSLEEQYTGRHWIDGKKVYQKVIIWTILIEEEDECLITVPIGASVDSFVDVRAYIANFSTGVLLIPTVNNDISKGANNGGDDNYNGSDITVSYICRNNNSSATPNSLCFMGGYYRKENDNVVLKNRFYEAFNGRKLQVIIQYTKTTDT